MLETGLFIGLCDTLIVGTDTGAEQIESGVRATPGEPAQEPSRALSSSRISAVRDAPMRSQPDLGRFDHRIERPKAAGRLELHVQAATTAASGAGRPSWRPRSHNPSMSSRNRRPLHHRSGTAAPSARHSENSSRRSLSRSSRRHARPSVTAAMSARDGLPLATLGLADIDDHVQLGRSVGHRLPSFKDLHCRRVTAVRKPDRRPHSHPRALEDARRQRHRPPA